MRRNKGTAVFLTRGESVYLSRRKTGGEFPGMLQLCGGRIEPGESPEIGALREVYEETGLHFLPYRLQALGADATLKNARGQPFTVYFFRIALLADEWPRDAEPDKQGPWTLWQLARLRDRTDLLPGLEAVLTGRSPVRFSL